MKITFTIPDEQVYRLVDAFLDSYMVDEETRAFTPVQWARESVRRFLVNRVHDFELKRARDSIVVTKDNDLIS